MLLIDRENRVLRAFGQQVPCVLGKGGTIAAAAKREGDGATPLGAWPVLCALLRPDRVPLPAGLQLPWRWMRPDDGWSDDPADPAYNRPVSHPHRFSAERLWREDHVYDVIVVLGHNSSPVRPGWGSAIFWHLARPDHRPTEGCVAIDRAQMLALLPLLKPDMPLTIR